MRHHYRNNAPTWQPQCLTQLLPYLRLECLLYSCCIDSIWDDNTLTARSTAVGHVLLLISCRYKRNVMNDTIEHPHFEPLRKWQPRDYRVMFSAHPERNT